MKDHLPFFSVIIPTYNRPAQLAQCLQALSRIDYPPEKFEVIVVDDGSAEPPESVIRRFRELLDVRLCSQANAGPAAARNLGAGQSRGEFFAFTDDDCAPAAGWLRALAARFAEYPDRLIGGRTLNALSDNLYSETSQLIIDVVYAHFNADPDDARFFASNNFALPSARFHELGGFNETFDTSEDREICDRWRARGLALSYAPEAIIQHAHALGLRKLWSQHFGYGRGAYRFHHERTARGNKPFKPDLTFYLKLLRAASERSRGRRAPGLTTLLLWSQLANTAGFFYESYQSRKRLLKAGDNAAPT
jgi:glycosyltransferase involved in cell wall biosynthesis